MMTDFDNHTAMPTLATAADLARRWGISRASMTELKARHTQTFPTPIQYVSNGRQPLWDVAQADAWRTHHKRREGDAYSTASS